MANDPEPSAGSNARMVSAYLLMAAFVVFTAAGAFLIYPAAGLIVAGIGCGLYAYLLGAD